MAIAEKEATEKVEKPVEKLAPRKFENPGNHRRFSAIRSLKMLVPRCQSITELGFEGCQDRHNRRWAWWEDCKKRGHDPYYSPARRTEKQPILSDPDAQGRRKVEGYDETVWWEETPNLKQVQVTPRVAGDRFGLNSIQFAQRAGCIFPSEHPTKPIADFCQYHNCWSQDITVRSPQGNYCNDQALRQIKMDLNEESVEVMHPTKMQRQREGQAV